MNLSLLASSDCPVLPESPADVLQAALKAAERRATGQRVPCSGRVQVIQDNADCPGARPEIDLGFITDVSAEGCRLLVPRGLAADRFWVRLLGTDPQLEFIECRIRWTTATPGKGIQPCGVQFERMLSREEFQELLAARTPESPP